MALREEYYLCFHFILVIRRAPFSIISVDQIFQVARQPRRDGLLLPQGMLTLGSHSTLTPHWGRGCWGHPWGAAPTSLPVPQGQRGSGSAAMPRSPTGAACTRDKDRQGASTRTRVPHLCLQTGREREPTDLLGGAGPGAGTYEPQQPNQPGQQKL